MAVPGLSNPVFPCFAFLAFSLNNGAFLQVPSHFDQILTILFTLSGLPRSVLFSLNLFFYLLLALLLPPPPPQLIFRGFGSAGGKKGRFCSLFSLSKFLVMLAYNYRHV